MILPPRYEKHALNYVLFHVDITENLHFQSTAIKTILIINYCEYIGMVVH